MTKRIKRSEKLEISLVVKDDQFIRPPQEAQRNALLNQSLKELVEDLHALDQQAAHFVSGEIQQGLNERTQRELSDEEIMEDWQIPIMQKMAKIAGASKGDVLEIGFGRGVSSSFIQEQQVKRHTIIECNDAVVARYHDWKQQFLHQDIQLVHGLWQDTIDQLGTFDSIFFHTYPLSPEEYMNYVNASVTFAAHFFATAAKHLKPGGVFTYLTNEIDSLSRAHQRLLFEHFASFSLQVVPLQLPENVKDTWWANSMIVIKAIK